LRSGIDAEHHPHVPATDLDAPYEGADDVAPHIPVRSVQLPSNQGCERLQFADDELERAGLLGDVPKSCSFGLQLGDALAQSCKPWFELNLTDHPFRIAVDQAADATTQFGPTWTPTSEKPFRISSLQGHHQPLAPQMAICG